MFWTDDDMVDCNLPFLEVNLRRALRLCRYALLFDNDFESVISWLS